MTVERFLQEAKSHLGYKTRPSGLSDFGQRVGYGGHDLPWSGAFIDVVARDSGIFIPACIYTPNALAEAMYSRRVKKDPRPGDIVFYNFPTLTGFGMPHVGIITDTSRWKTEKIFSAIEGQVNSGLPKASKDKTGVFPRTRGKWDVVAFYRPDFKARPDKGPKNSATGPKTIKMHNIRPGKTHPEVKIVHQALSSFFSLRQIPRDTFDLDMQRTFARWQRMIGFVGEDASGVPNEPSLARLGRETGFFDVKTSNNASSHES
jgi:hypothetical protein